LLCGKSFVWSNKASKRRQESVWFHKWIKEGYSIRQLSSISGYHPDRLRDIIHVNLVLPAPVCTDFTECHYLLCDGTFIEGRKHGLFVVMGAGSNKVVAGKYDVKEKQSDLIQYFKDLKTQGMNPRSFTTDGSTAILKALRTVWPDVIIQRCMVHIQRQGLMWCRAKPKLQVLEVRKLLRNFYELLWLGTINMVRDCF
jgi:Transposase, Mutator family